MEFGTPLTQGTPQAIQQSPAVLEAVLFEQLSGANHAWTMAPGLLHAAYEGLKHHGSDALKAAYLGKIASGEWLATLCLTEAHAGSDLGQVRTRALARPAGRYGLLLFLAPKMLPDGTRNTLHCERIEEEMGLHDSPTCVMRFDEASAWLIGESQRGLNAMFVMLNAARLHVGLQGLGLLDVAW
ncbi:MAG: alkylation response protein AidB-like acyl-CoA dehydrogenase [Rhodoferax sp.]|jgi:alkylation response protein AidB-like acyl-CoA dehydrogenase